MPNKIGTVRLRYSEKNVNELEKLGFTIMNTPPEDWTLTHIIVWVSSLKYAVVSLGYKAKSPKHQPLIELEHLKPVMLLGFTEATRVYIEQITGRVLV